jgi:mannosyltransferase
MRGAGWAKAIAGTAARVPPARVRGALIVVLLLAFGLRLYHLGYQSLWYDEAVSIHLAAKDLTALTLHTAGDIHPPLYYYLLHFWVLVAGSSEFSAAFFSLVFGLLLVALVYRLAREACGSGIALLAAFLVAVSPFNLWYSQEVRMYTLGAFLGLVTLYCLMRLAALPRGGDRSTPGGEEGGTNRARWRFWIGYVLAGAAGLYTLYYFAFLLLFENLFVLAWWLAGRRSAKTEPLRLTSWIAAQALIVVLYLPWLPTAARQALNPPVPPWRGFTGLAGVITESWAALCLGQSVEPESLLIWPVLSFMFAIYLLGVAGYARRSRDWSTSLLLCGYTFVPVFAIYLLSLRTPLFHVRYVFTYSPPFYILLAMGSSWLGRRWRAALPLAVGIITVACGYSIFLFHSSPLYASDDHRAAVSYLEERVAPGDAVLIDAGYAYPPFLYYFEGQIAWRGRLVDYQTGGETEQGVVLLQTGTIGGDEGLGWGDPSSDFYATTAEETAEALERVFSEHPRLWVYRIYDTVTDPEGFIRDWLQEHGRLIGDEGFVGESYIRVQCYQTATEPQYDAALVSHSVAMDTGLGIELLGYDSPSMVRSGEELPLRLHWQVDDEWDTSLDISVSLALDDGLPLAEVETTVSPATAGWKPGELVAQEVLLEVPPGTAPLEYKLVLEWQESSSDRDTGAGGGSLSLGKVSVLRPLVPSPTPRMPHEPWANFGNLVELTGYEVTAEGLGAGDQIRAQLLWRAWNVPLPLMEMELVLADGEGAALASAGMDYPGDAYPSTLWEREELVGAVYLLDIPEDALPGRYQLNLVLRARAASGAWRAVPFLASSGGWEESFSLATVEINP